MPRRTARSRTRPLTDRLARYDEQLRKMGTPNPFAGSGFSPDGSGSLGATGSVDIPVGSHLNVNGGTVEVADPTGNPLLTFADQPLGDRGITLYRTDGTPVLVVRATSVAGGAQSLLIYDKAGRVIGGGAQNAYSGIDAPYLPIPFAPTDLTSGARAQATTATSYTALFEHAGYYQNPGLRLQVKAFCSDGTTAGLVEVYDTLAGVELGTLASSTPQTITIPAGTTTATVFTAAAPYALPGSMGDDLSLQVRVKRTAGTGSVSVAISRSFGCAI